MRNSPIYNGLILGGLLIITSFAMQLINPKGFIMYGSFISLLVIIGMLVKSGNDAKFFNEGQLTLGEAVISMFIPAAIGIAMCTVFSYLLYHYINPDLVNVAMEVVVEQGSKVLELMEGVLNEDIDVEEAFDTINPNDILPTFPTSVLEYIVRLIFPGLFCSLIIGLIIKTN